MKGFCLFVVMPEFFLIALAVMVLACEEKKKEQNRVLLSCQFTTLAMLSSSVSGFCWQHSKRNSVFISTGHSVLAELSHITASTLIGAVFFIFPGVFLQR